GAECLPEGRPRRCRPASRGNRCTTPGPPSTGPPTPPRAAGPYAAPRSSRRARSPPTGARAASANPSATTPAVTTARCPAARTPATSAIPARTSNLDGSLLTEDMNKGGGPSGPPPVSCWICSVPGPRSPAIRREPHRYVSPRTGPPVGTQLVVLDGHQPQQLRPPAEVLG